MINIDYSSIEIGESGDFTGLINLELSKGVYPEKEWNDFILVNLIQWIEEILAIKDQMNFYFYDGNLILSIVDKGENYIELGSNNDFNFSVFIKDLIYHTNKILREYKDELSDNPDFNKLNELFERLRLINKQLNSISE